MPKTLFRASANGKAHKKATTPRPKASEPTAGNSSADQRVGLVSNRMLAKRLQGQRQGSDDVSIGSDQTSVEVEGATMEDVSKLIDGVQYLVRDWIPFGMVTGVVAEPGVGKSAFTLWLAFIVMTAGRWFNGKRGPKKAGYVLWCPTENDMAITRQRMLDWDIPMNRLILPFKDDPLRPVNLTDPEHLEHIESLVNKYRPPMVVIDSLRSGHDGDENNSRVGRVLQDLARIAERTKTAMIVVHHTRKLLEGEEITSNSSRGSNAILAMMRSQIGIDRPDPKSRWCRVRVLKENLGIAPKPIGFQVTSNGLEFGDSPERPKQATQKDAAADWLREQMTPGEVYKASDLLEEAQQHGHSERTVRRAATSILGIKPEREQNEDGKITGWTWTLPTGDATDTT